MSEDKPAVKEEVAQEPLEVTPPAPAADVDNWLAEPGEDEGIELDPEDIPADEEYPAEEEADEPAEEDPAEEESEEEAPDAPKTEKAKNRFQQLANENNLLSVENRELRDKIRNLVREQYSPQTAEEIMEQDETVDEDKAELLALKQRVEASDFNNHVVELNSNINIDATSVMRQFPEFDPTSDEYDKEFAEQTRDGYFKRAKVQFDETGTYVISAEEALYDYYKEMAEIRRKAIDTGRTKRKQAQADMLSRVDSRPAAKPAADSKSEEDDPFLRGFNSI
jgi:hypothetical protein